MESYLEVTRYKTNGGELDKGLRLEHDWTGFSIRKRTSEGIFGFSRVSGDKESILASHKSRMINLLSSHAKGPEDQRIRVSGVVTCKLEEA